MFTVDEKTTFVGITDLRVHAKRMLSLLKGSHVVITDRNTPRAVVLDYDQFNKMRDLIDMAEEELMAPVVLRRKMKSRGHFLSHEEIVKKISKK